MTGSVGDEENCYWDCEGILRGRTSTSKGMEVGKHRFCRTEARKRAGAESREVGTMLWRALNAGWETVPNSVGPRGTIEGSAGEETSGFSGSGVTESDETAEEAWGSPGSEQSHAE